MGLFGSEDEEREEVTIGVSEEEETENEKKDDVSPEVGTVDFGGEDTSADKDRDSESNLRNEVSNLDSVDSTETSSTSSTSKTGAAASGSPDSDMKAIKKQNQKIIEKLDKVLSKL